MITENELTGLARLEAWEAISRGRLPENLEHDRILSLMSENGAFDSPTQQMSQAQKRRTMRQQIRGLPPLKRRKNKKGGVKNGNR